MNETYSHLKDLATLYRGPQDNEQISLNYQDNEDAVMLSYVYCKNIGLTMTVSDRFFGLTEEDVASFALEELHKAMMNYRTEGGAKLSTLYSKYLKNRLRTETQALNYDKRKSNSMAESYEGSMEQTDNGDTKQTGLESKLGYEESIFAEIELLMSLEGKQELSQNEYRYCEIIVKEVSDVTQIRDSDIAKMLNISSAAVHYIKKSLQKKIAIKTNSNFLLSI